jgi:hypothetical protein
LRGKDVAFGIHQLDQHLVLAARHARQDDGVALAEIRPQPRQVVDRDVQMADATPWANGPGSGGSTNSLGVGSLSMGTTVLWAKAPVAIAVPSAGVSISWLIAFSPFEIRYTEDDAHLARHPPYGLFELP